MVVAWELRDGDNGLVGTFFDEKKAIKARDRLEKQGWTIKILKVFDHDKKDRDPVVKVPRKRGAGPETAKKPKERNVPDLIPEGTRHIMVFVRPGDLITSELGMGFNHRGKVTDGVTRIIVSDKGKLVPVITKGDEKKS